MEVVMQAQPHLPLRELSLLEAVCAAPYIDRATLKSDAYYGLGITDWKSVPRGLQRAGTAGVQTGRVR